MVMVMVLLLVMTTEDERTEQEVVMVAAAELKDDKGEKGVRDIGDVVNSDIYSIERLESEKK
jgi:hypothetical protein